MKNNNFKYYHLLFGLLLGLASCQTVIDIDLNNVTPRLVIEGNLANDGTACVVQLSKTIDFQQSTTINGVLGAVITLSDNTGNSETLVPQSNGLYKSEKIRGVVGRTYTLNVNVEGKTYTATSTLPKPVNMDSLRVNKIAGFGSTNYQIIPVYRDPAGVLNYYNFNLYVNSKKSLSVYPRNDELSDGNVVTQPLFGDQTEKKAGDVITVEMQAVDATVYTYYYSLSKNGGGPNGAATPANPISNFSGGCLGYFSAHTTQTKSMMLK